MSMTYKLINTTEQYEELLAITNLEDRKTPDARMRAGGEELYRRL